MDIECENMVKSFVESVGKKSMVCYYDSENMYVCNYQLQSCNMREKETKYMLKTYIIPNEHIKMNHCDGNNCKGFIFYKN